MCFSKLSCDKILAKKCFLTSTSESKTIAREASAPAKPGSSFWFGPSEIGKIVVGFPPFKGPGGSAARYASGRRELSAMTNSLQKVL